MMDFKDVNSNKNDGTPDGQIDNYDQVVIAKYSGARNAPISYGLQFNINYKGFSLFTQFGGLAGFKTPYGDPWGRAYGGGLFATTYFNNAWTTTNNNSDVPKIYLSGDARSMGYVVNSRYNTFNGSFLRLKNLTLNYTFPDFPKNIGISRLSVFASANNLFCIRGFKFYDPELANGMNSYPIMKTITLGININL